MKHPQTPSVAPAGAGTGFDRMFASTGHTGNLIQTLDWSATPLGEMSSWPQSLRTTVSLCLASRFPIVLYWGPDLLTLYNDAYAPILASKHPWALGRPCRAVWSEIWDVIGPMMAGVMNTGVATWSDDMLLVLERHGYPEECYFSFSFSPVHAEGGEVGGVFTAVIETTERVVGARRLLTLRELGQQISEAGSAEQTCGRAASALARNPEDVPFSLVYLLDSQGLQAALVGASGIEPGQLASPAVIAIDGAGSGAGWPLARVAAGGGAELVSLGERFESAPAGPWPDPPATAMLLPIARAGQIRPYGVLIAGVSSRRPLDEAYRAFYDLLAAAVTTAVVNARAYEEERARAEAMAEIDRAKTAFFSNVSHEFRTPLTLMMGPLDELLRSPLPPERARDELRVIHRNGLRLLKLVNTLLDFSRIEAGRVEALFEPTDLSALTAELASVFRSAVERAGLTLRVECAPLPEPVYVDREMWEKIVLNLLSNAFKFTFQGEIAIGVRSVDTMVELYVSDTGVGIGPRDLPHVFERFHRVKGGRARTHEGTGIGLALVQELVTLHGGAIHADSIEGKGTTLTVSIPRGAAHVPADRIRAGRTLASTATAAQSYIEEGLGWLPDDVRAETVVDPFPPADVGATGAEAIQRSYILCADDNADMRDYLTRLLGRHYEVAAVPDGEAAVRAIRGRMPDLVISDVMMPGLDGFRLLSALREDPATQALPVVLLSARAGEQSRVEGLGAGADDYLVKPFSSRELLARVAALLEIARVRKALVRTEQAARTAIEAGEEERRRISRELHDEMGQELAALVLGIKLARNDSGEASPIDARLQHLQAQAEEMGKHIHRIAVELRPAALDALGLDAGLSSYVEDWGKRHEIDVEFQSVGAGAHPLPGYIEATIYRIVQEALTNVGRHARATTVNVILQRAARDVLLIVEDDGRGFDTSMPAERGGTAPLGLLGMSERAALVGGSFNIESQPGGTTLFIRIPLPPAEGRADG